MRGRQKDDIAPSSNSEKLPTHCTPHPPALPHNVHRFAWLQTARFCARAHAVAGQTVQVEEVLAHPDGCHVAGHAQVAGGAEATRVEDAVAVDQDDLQKSGHLWFAACWRLHSANSLKVTNLTWSMIRCLPLEMLAEKRGQNLVVCICVPPVAIRPSWLSTSSLCERRPCLSHHVITRNGKKKSAKEICSGVYIVHKLAVGALADWRQAFSIVFALLQEPSI